MYIFLMAFWAADTFRIRVLIEGFFSPKSILAFCSRHGAIPLPWSSLSVKFKAYNFQHNLIDCVTDSHNNTYTTPSSVKSYMENEGKQKYLNL